MERVLSQAASCGKLKGLTKGQVEIALRKYNWNVEDLVSECKGFKNSDEVACALAVRPIPTVSAGRGGETRTCVGYFAVDENAEQKQKKLLKTPLYKLVKKLLQKGKNFRDILNEAKTKGHKPGDVMRAIQTVKSSLLLKGKTIKAATDCDRSKGCIPVTKGAALGCGHFRCADHWKGFLSSQIDQGIACLQTKCNVLVCTKNHVHSWKDRCFCEEKVPRETFERFVQDENLIAKYRRFALKSFKDYSEKAGVTKCPGRGCNLWWTRDEKRAPQCLKIECKCGTEFCHGCGVAPAHEPLPCASAIDWNERSSEDDQTRIRRELNTATCPNPRCGVRIERYIDNDNHCLHMICTQCKFHWCWACRREFKTGANGNHENFYKCSFLQTGAVGEDVKKREEVMRGLQIFKFYEERIRDCNDDVRDLEKLRKALDEQLYNKKKQDEYQFLFKAIEQLIVAAKQKIVLNKVAFYAAKDSKKGLFEFQLKYMADNYDSLLEKLISQSGPASIASMLPGDVRSLPRARIVMLIAQLREKRAKRSVARPLKFYKENKEKICQAAKSVSEFFPKLIAKIKAGQLVTILPKPDPKNTTWYCTRCKRNNEFGSSVCECAWTTVGQ